MKKIYTLIATMAVVFSATAQNKVSGTATSGQAITKALQIYGPADRALGDTLMWYPSPGIYLANAGDQTAFTQVNEDIDGLTPNNAGETMDWGLYFSTDNSMAGSAPTADNFYQSWENPILSGGTDSAFFWHATSWFAPLACCADNWMMMGPVTLPAGATLKWFDRTNPSYRDGYRVLISTTVSSPMTFTDFSGTAIYTKTDSYPSVTYATDTTWVQRSVGIPAMYSAQPIYIAFNHNANDMDVLYLDEFLVVESTSGVDEFTNGVKLGQNMPNPASAMSTISYELENSAKVAFNVYDVTGKLVHSRNIGDVSAGTHNIYFNADDLAAGVYHYSLSVNENVTSAKKMVIVK